MQNEITELRNQVRTLKRMVCLACCLLALFYSIGCSGSQPTKYTYQYNEMTEEWERWSTPRQLDSPHLRKQRPPTDSLKVDIPNQLNREARRLAWDPSELRVGLTQSEVIDLFGEPTSIRNEHGMEIWDYEFQYWNQNVESTISNLLKFIVLDTGAELRFWNLRNVKSYGYPELKGKKKLSWPPGRPPIPPSPRELQREQQRLHLEETDRQSSIANRFTVPEFKVNTWYGRPFDPSRFVLGSSFPHPRHKGSTPIEIIKLYGPPDVFDLRWSSSSKYDEFTYKEAIEDQDSYFYSRYPFSFLIQYRKNDDEVKYYLDHCVTFSFKFSFVNQEVPRNDWDIFGNTPFYR